MAQADGKAKWLQAKADFLRRLKEIDKETPPSSPMPKWWSDMTAAESFVRDLK